MFLRLRRAKANPVPPTEELAAVYEIMRNYWEKSMKWHAPFDDTVEVQFEVAPDYQSVYFYIYTEKQVYRITGKPNGYLGCGRSLRAPYPTEDWTRGRDLSDGDLNFHTWREIMVDIAASELLDISQYLINTST